MLLFGCPGSRVGDVIQHGGASEIDRRGNPETQQLPRSTANFHIHRVNYFLEGQPQSSQPSRLRTTAGRIGRGTVDAMANARSQFASIGGGLASRLSARLTRQGEPNRQPVGHQTNLALQVIVNPPNTPVDVNDQATPTSPSASPPNALQPNTLEALISQIMSEQLLGPPNASHQHSGIDSRAPQNQGTGDHAVSADVAPNHPLPHSAEEHHGQNLEAGAIGSENNTVRQQDGSLIHINPEGIAAAIAARHQGPPQPLALAPEHFIPELPNQGDLVGTTPSVTPASSLRSVSDHNQGLFSRVKKSVSRITRR